LTSLLILQIIRFTDAQILKSFYPSLCSEFLKRILNFSPKVSQTNLINAVDFLLYTFEKLFSNSVYKHQFSKDKIFVNKIQNITSQFSQKNQKIGNQESQSNTVANEDIVRLFLF